MGIDGFQQVSAGPTISQCLLVHLSRSWWVRGFRQDVEGLGGSSWVLEDLGGSWRVSAGLGGSRRISAGHCRSCQISVFVGTSY